MNASGQPDRSHPERLRLRCLVPSLTVKDLQASLTWYRDVVGFHVEEAHEYEGQVRGYTLIAGTQRLLIGQDDGAKGVDKPWGPRAFNPADPDGFAFTIMSEM